MRRSSIWILLLLLAACTESDDSFGSGPDPTDDGGELGDADLRVVFVGNSLTDTHDVPGLVQAMAEVAGQSMAHAVITRPGVSLEDHWHAGAPARLRELAADVVVLQQGPSSLPANQEHLAQWAGRFAGVIREAGGEPALYMVWPSSSRRFAFEDVWTSYRNAALAVEGLLAPAGQTWIEAWELDDGLALYGPDGFHPTYLGALVAAQTIYAVLFGVTGEEVPALDDGFGAEMRTLLAEAVDASLQRAATGDAAGAVAGAPTVDR